MQPSAADARGKHSDVNEPLVSLPTTTKILKLSCWKFLSAAAAAANHSNLLFVFVV